MRIAVAEIAQETDSFSRMVTGRRDFETYGLFFGDEILQRMQGVGPIGGLLDVVAASSEPITLLPIVRAWASAGGKIADEVLAFLTEQLLHGLRRSLPVDAVFLCLHGAASTESEDDVEGGVLGAVREVVGTGVPIVCPLDHHANITRKMVQCADFLIGHETQPHDPRATGRKAARALLRMLRHEIRPTIAWHKIPMITPQDQFLTSQGPMKEWFDLAREMECRDGVIDVSPYPMQPWLDVEEGGWSVVVHTDGDALLARSLAAEMANKAWQLREQFWVSERVAAAEAVRKAVEAKKGLIILSDTGDSVYGGAPGDSTCILRAMLQQQIPSRALLPIIDAAAVRKASAAGVGARLDLELGGKIDNVFSQPVDVSGRVAAVSHGLTVTLADRGVCDLGPTALLEVGEIRVALLEQRSFAINHPVLYTHLGAEIADAKMVVVKTASNFQFFQRWRAGLIRVDSPGVTQSDLTAFHWQRIPHPTYPLDELNEWEGGVSGDW